MNTYGDIGHLLDYDGYIICSKSAKRFERIIIALSRVHPTRIRRYGNTIQLLHGPQDLGLYSFTEVQGLCKHLGRGDSLPLALAKVRGVITRKPQLTESELQMCTDEAIHLEKKYDPSLDGAIEPVRHYPKKTKRFYAPKRVNSTPLPRELTVEERRAIWQPPNSPFR